MAGKPAARRPAGLVPGSARRPPPGTQLDLDFDTPPSALPAPPVGPLRRISLGGQVCEYRLRRARRRTIGFQIDDAGLTISAPRWVPLREIEEAIVEKERWIRSRLEQWRHWRAQRRLTQVEFADGGRLPYLGAHITLRLRAELPASMLVATPEGEELRLALPPEAGAAQVRDSVQAWLKEQALRILGERLQLLAARSGVAFSSWALSSARSQWGSCAADGRIRLNWRLVHFALPVIDYVVAHELAHLKELNHGPAFWRQVARLLPGFEAARDHIRNEDLDSLPL